MSVYLTLRELRDKPGSTSKQIASALGYRHVSIASEYLARLERRGMVRRGDCVSERRGGRPAVIWHPV